ncbi:hypothetical protein MK489_09205 [Myxococcota bacterium]|nr:hypothetical protein [Myxococcota bacterium]
MNRTRSLLLIVIAGLNMGQQCEQPDFVLEGVRVLEPHAHAVRNCKPFRIEIDFNEHGDESTLTVLVNGVDVSDRLQLDPAARGRVMARAEWVWDDDLLWLGENTIEATVDFPHGTMMRTRTFEVEGDAFADAVVSFTPGSQSGFNQAALPEVVLGEPDGGGMFFGGNDVVSLGLGGQIELAFEDNLIWNGEGADFTVFENPFLTLEPGLVVGAPFSEPGRVSVSQDGNTWYAFPCDLSIVNAPYHPGCAGVEPVVSNPGVPETHGALPTIGPGVEALLGLPALSLPDVVGPGGDSFDLSEVGLLWARYVRIEAANFASTPSGPDNAGFDLDAVAAIHSVPESGVTSGSGSVCATAP